MKRTDISIRIMPYSMRENLGQGKFLLFRSEGA